MTHFTANTSAYETHKRIVWRSKPTHLQGFTLVELVVVIVLLGILSVYATANFRSTDFYVPGFHNETMAYLRYAQKTAIAQRRVVCAEFTSNSLTLKIAAAASTAATTVTNCSTPGTMIGPVGSAVLNAPTGVTYAAATPASYNFNFNGLGQPTDGAGVVVGRSIQIQVNTHSKTIVVESETGYVHD